MLENVKMKAEFMDIITTEIEADSIMINSSLVSAQNRKRNYWSNIPIDQPKDLGVYLKDIIDESVQFEEQSDSWHKWWETNKEFQLKKKYSAIVNDGSTDKAICMTARQYASWNGNFLILQTPRGNNTGGIRAVNGKTPCLSSCSWQHNNHLIKNERYRKLTPRECFRLQTVPERLINLILSCGVSNSQLYKIAGNGWTDEVIGHILRGLHE